MFRLSEQCRLILQSNIGNVRKSKVSKITMFDQSEIRNPKSEICAGDLPAQMKDIPFSSIPHQSALFLKYLDQDTSVMRFYSRAATLDSLEKAAGEIASHPFPRNEMAAVLRRQNESFGADGEVFRSIDALEKPGSVAVVTGQQTGLFIGPLYTIYKALTAVCLAAELRRRGINAVPVFWMEADDHDFPEATRRAVLDGAGCVRTVDFGPKLFSKAEIAMRSVGSIRFTDSVRNVIKEYLAEIPDSGWKAGVAEMLETAYAPGRSFAEAFAVLTHRLLPETGLILFNPGDAEARRLAATVFSRALSEAEQIRFALIRRNAELSAAGFHAQAQVLPDSTVLFLTLDGKRQALERRGGVFQLKNSGEKFDCARILELAARTPEIFSPNVLLRPIVQDCLFPTVAYAGGAAEIAYFAQIEVLYSIFGRPMPVIWPRNGFTLIEPEIAEAMKRTGVEFTDLFLEKSELEEKTLRRSASCQTVEKLDRLYEKLDAGLTEIRSEAGKIEARLDGMTDAARRKILHNVRYLKSRAVRHEAARNEAVARDVDMAMNNLRPEGSLQERELTIFHFLAKRGPDVLAAIRVATDIENFTHRLIYF
jgi:bacillithiol biosynthesis cysteine-adding enzyme BshC